VLLRNDSFLEERMEELIPLCFKGIGNVNIVILLFLSEMFQKTIREKMFVYSENKMNVITKCPKYGLSKKIKTSYIIHQYILRFSLLLHFTYIGSATDYNAVT